MAYTLIFLLKKNVSSFRICICKSYSHLFSKNTCELDIVLNRTINILTTNELVKLTMLWTTGPWSVSSLGAFCIATDAKFLHADNEDADQTAHYENTPIQIYRKKFSSKKNPEIFSLKNSIFFKFLLKT